MYYLFAKCYSLSQIDLSNFDTKKTVNMENMFNSCTNLTKLDISSFETGRCRIFDDMFLNCNNLSVIVDEKKSFNLIETIPPYINIIYKDNYYV